jgi:phospholipid/cholesterol/gamma-HCH transport system substrate-binding protein
VRYSGVRVGEVVFIGLDHANPNRVRALIEVESITPINTDTVASLELAGLTGGRYILLSGGGAPNARRLTTQPGQRRPQIPSRSSNIESLLEGAPDLLEHATGLLLQARQLLNEENQRNVAEILARLNRFAGELVEDDGQVSQLLADSTAAMASFRSTAVRLEALAGRVESLLDSVDGLVGDARGDLVALVKDLRASAKSFGAMSDEVRDLVAENRAPLSAFAENGLQEFTTLLTEARDLLVNLNRVTTEVERDPARFLFGNQQQGYEVRGD